MGAGGRKQRGFQAQRTDRVDSVRTVWLGAADHRIFSVKACIALEDGLIEHMTTRVTEGDGIGERIRIRTRAGKTDTTVALAVSGHRYSLTLLDVAAVERLPAGFARQQQVGGR